MHSYLSRQFWVLIRCELRQPSLLDWFIKYVERIGTLLHELPFLFGIVVISANGSLVIEILGG